MPRRASSSRPFNLILLGDPGAGKGTQGAYLKRKYPFLQEFDFGQWLRDLTAGERERYRVDATAAKGILSPTQLARRKFRQVILDTPPGKGAFFNGCPRMVGEAREVIRSFREAKRDNVIVLYLSVPQREIFGRLRKRRSSEARSDDREEYLRNRLKYYPKHVYPTRDLFRRHYPFRNINGVGTRRQVFARIVAAVEKLRR